MMHGAGRRFRNAFVTAWCRARLESDPARRYSGKMKSLPAVAALGILCAAGCTAPNPSFVGDGGGGAAHDLAGVVVDLAGVVADLAGPMGTCTGDQRKCSGTAASDRCEGGMFVVDRQCPAASSCMNDYCAPPTATFGTQIGARCDANGGAQQLQCMASPTAALSCQPFVDPATKNVRWFCDTAVGAGRAMTMCTMGAECRSGVCTDAGNCFDACQRDQDRVSAGTGAVLTCKSFNITVEGVTVSAKGCG